MADKILKSITFPGSEDVYKILVDYDDIENNILNRGEGLNSIQQELTFDEEDIAKDKAPQAIGGCTVALGECHMVEGETGFACNYNNIVYGKRSFAANANQLVYADHGAAFGNHNRIVGLRGFSIGTDNFACGENSFTLGNQTRTGQLLNEYDAATHQYLPMQDDTGKDILDAEGNSVLFPDTTKGLRAIASGYNTQATGTNAIAAGNNTIASGSNAIAAGNNTIASGDNAFAANAENEAKGINSFTANRDNHAIGDASFAIGHSDYAEGDNSIATGLQTQAKGKNSATFGEGTRTGENVKSDPESGMNAVALGKMTNANGKNAVTIGYLTNANGLNSFAGGSGSQAQGQYDFAFGFETQATGGGTTAFGKQTKAKASYSFAGGDNSEVSNDACYSIVHGRGLKATAEAQAVFGKYNKLSTEALFMIGNGTDENNRSNAFAVLADGSVIVNNTDYLNPPMMPGVEYRTTERSEGKPVYAKRISYTPGTTLGKVGSNTDTSIAHEIANFNYLVRCSGRHTTYSLPELTMTGGTVSINQVDKSAIVLRHINTVTSATTWYFDLYYTKTTD